MKRVTYNQIGNMLVSEPVLAQGHTLECYIDLSDNSFTIVRDESDTIAEGNATSLSYAKMKARRAMEAVGAIFDKEMRKRVTLETAKQEVKFLGGSEI